MNRVASIIFTRKFMKEGVSAENMEDLFSELPEGTKVLGFGEDICRNVMQINVCHEHFKEVPVGSVLPEIIATFTVDEDGIEDCELDLSSVIEDGYVLRGYDIVSKEELRGLEVDNFYIDEWNGFTTAVYDEPAEPLSIEMMQRAYDRLEGNCNKTPTLICSTPSSSTNELYDLWRKDLENNFGIPKTFLNDRDADHLDSIRYSVPIFGNRQDESENPDTEEEVCQHNLVPYQGLFENYNYCEKCGKKESELE